jgi:hypothetical protein
MADSTLAKLLQVIDKGESAELRRAAVLVSGSVGTDKDRDLVRSLLRILHEDQVDLRLAAIDSLGRLRADEGLEPLTGFVRQGGPELEAAVRAVGQLGPRGVRSLGKIMNEAAPALRSRMAAVLAKSGTGGGLVVTAHALLDPDPKVVDAAARSLAAEVPSLNASQKHSLGKFLTESLQAKNGLGAKTEAAVLRLLGNLHEAKAEDAFWARLGREAAPEVRAAAVQALGQSAAAPTAAQLHRLADCAADADFQIVAPALMILHKVPASAKNTKTWLKLLDAPDVATRRFAVEKLAGVQSAEVARGLMAQLGHADRALRDQARQVLLGFAKGRQALFDRLSEAETAEECWDLARGLAPAARDFSSAQRARLLAQACRYHDRDDRRAAPLWHLLRDMDSAWTRGQIEALALGMRKKKKYAAAVSYYRMLAQDPACSEDVRFELAAAGLKISNHDLAVEARQADHALGQFGRLLRNPSFDLAARVSQAKWLGADDLFYLGFHFIEDTHRARDFGAQVLELVVKRSPKSETGKNARKKLRSAGVG